VFEKRVWGKGSMNVRVKNSCTSHIVALVLGYWFCSEKVMDMERID